MQNIHSQPSEVETPLPQPTEYICKICGYTTYTPAPSDLGRVRGNTARFMNVLCLLWKCPQCASIYSVDTVDFSNIYKNYPLNNRRLDVFARGTLHNLLKRLQRAGLKQEHSILDYGCGNGVLLEYLREQGYQDLRGYDPYVEEFRTLTSGNLFDCVIANDVIEHVPDPRETVHECANLIKPGGLLYLGTTDSEPVDMRHLEPHIMRLHQPFHRVLITQESLKKLALDTGFKLVQSYRRSYMDTLMPFSNYRFLDEFNKALGHNMDAALDPSASRIFLRNPGLLFYGLFGYFFPSAYEPAVVLRRPLS